MILGIDLGTTNSLASVIIDGTTEFVLFDEKRLLPSIVTFLDDKSLLIGQKAKNQYLLDPENSVKSIKRLMGSDTVITIQEIDYHPEEISAIILKHIKKTAEEQFSRTFIDAVITVPAYFSDDQRKATALAGKIAGFDVKRIINEPTAASLSYNFDHKEEIRAVVYDLGGGTFDVSVVNISENIVEVLASHGNNQLGGDDFDNNLTDHIIRRCEKFYNLDLRDNKAVHHQITAIAERCKIALSDAPFYTITENIQVEPGVPAIPIELEISRDEFEGLIQTYIDETMHLVHLTMEDVNLHTSDIDQILLVGGSSKIPLVAREFRSIFEFAPSGSIDPDQCVAIGAAIQGGIIGQKKINSILVDVTPYTYGTRVAQQNEFGMIEDDDIFSPVIRRNTPLPTSKTKVLYKFHKEQESVRMDIYQGESEVASENKRIGTFVVENLSADRDNIEILLAMNLDLNGLLTVIATEKNAGKSKQITIDNAFDHGDLSISVNKLAEFYDDLPSTNDEQSDDSSEQTDNNKIFIAKTMIEKAEKKMDQASTEDREEMTAIIETLNQEISAGNQSAVEKLTDELTDILFYID